METAAPVRLDDPALRADPAESGLPSVARRRPPDERINWRSSAPFLLFHLAPLGLLVTGVSRADLVLCAVTYSARLLFVTAGYHRYFAHRSYKLGRVPQLLLAFGGTTAVQKGPLWWAGHHRRHHRYADTDIDPHSPIRGFWWSHIGWILCNKYDPTPYDAIRDFATYPELRFVNRQDWIGPLALATGCLVFGGWSGLLAGFFLSTILLWHATFAVNSVAHLFGRRRYATSDTSRNSLLVAIITGGEGWHNNHHHYQTSAKQGFFWWEFDPTYYLLRALSVVGIVRGLRRPPPSALTGGREMVAPPPRPSPGGRPPQR